MYTDKEYLGVVTAYMLNKYALTLQDTGYSTEEWLMRFGDQPAIEAVEEYALKYALVAREEAYKDA